MRVPGDGRHALGYSLIEILTVLAIVGFMMLVSVPSIVRWNEIYLMRSSARDFANALKLGRMKAVAANQSFVTELNPPAGIRNQCPGQTVAIPPVIFVVYQSVPAPAIAKAEECFRGAKGIKAEQVAGASKAVTFKSNGMAVVAASPNRFKVTSRNGKFCQLVCVTPAGGVQLGAVLEGADCTTPPANCSVN